MASLVRAGFGKLSGKLLVTSTNFQVIRTITSKLDDLPPKPKPWNYNEKSYTLLNYFFDKTTDRFDENTKLIVVDGPLAAGKSKFAKEIAESFGMLYLPEANLDMYYINSYGYDLRKLDPMLPPDCRSFDVNDFMRQPNNKKSIRMQIWQYILRYSQYIDALAHILSTGQGVVLDRCVYSDFVFIEAMYSQKFISKQGYRKYYEYRDNTLQDLLRPHLIVYLDVPVPKVLENINKRNISYEKNSPVLTPQYLEVMEKHYKQHYLKEMAEHAELLVYDWSVEGDMEIVVEDIEAVDFTKYDLQEPQMKDWHIELEEDWACLRYKYADRKNYIMANTNIPAYDCPELLVGATDMEKYYKLMEEAPGQKYLHGYNANLGDSNLLLKVFGPKRDTLPLRERSVS